MTTKKSMSPSIAVLILNWNGQSLLEKYLPSVINLDHPSLNVCVIDNGSTDDSVQFLAESFPTVQVITLNENLGFAPAYNKAVADINADILVLLNNDVEVRTDWLSALVQPLIEDTQIGITGSKLYFADGNTLQHAGAALSYPRATGRHRFYRETDAGQADELCAIDYVTGAAMAVHRRVLDKIGFFDATFAPMYFEEVDFCFRAKQAGFRVVYVPRSIAIHHESMSIRQDQPKLFHHLNKNRLYFVLKHYTPQQFLGDFVPAEKQYLSQVKDPTQRQIMRQVYFEMLWLLPVKQSEFDNTIPMASYQSELLDLAQTAVSPAISISPKPQMLTEFAFSSATGTLRQAWHNVSGKWATRHLIQQQNELNQQLFNRLETLSRQDQASASEIGMIVKEMTELQLRLAEIVADLSGEISTLEVRISKLEDVVSKEAGK